MRVECARTSGVAVASACRHPTRLLTPMRPRKPGRFHQIDGAASPYIAPRKLIQNPLMESLKGRDIHVPPFGLSNRDRRSWSAPYPRRPSHFLASSSVAEMRRDLAIERESGSIVRLSSLEAALAEAEASAGETDAGLRRLPIRKPGIS